jgi:hypothetical protein
LKRIIVEVADDFGASMGEVLEMFTQAQIGQVYRVKIEQAGPDPEEAPALQGPAARQVFVQKLSERGVNLRPGA